MIDLEHAKKFGYDPIIRDIPDFPNYQISENGEVYNKTIGKKLKVRDDGSVRLTLNGKRYVVNTKKLVVLLFEDYNDEFVEIKRYPNYQISREGLVRNKFTKIVLKPWIINSGYFVVGLSDRKKELVHRLVAETFIDNEQNKPCVDHINRNKFDNRVENLRCVTNSENQFNLPINSSNTTGVKGISFCSEKRKNGTYEYYVASVIKNGKAVSKKITKNDPDAIEKLSKWRIEKVQELHTIS